MNELYGYARGSQRSAGTKRGRSTSRGSSRSRSRSAGAALSGTMITGHYQGKLRPPKRLKAPSKYDKAGYSKEIERFGTQSLSDVCYLGATSYCKDDLAAVIGVALIRKLLKRHYQFEYTHPDQSILRSGSNTGLGPVSISFWYEKLEKIDAQPTIDVGATFLIRDVAGLTTTAATLSDFGSWFVQYLVYNPLFGGGNSTTVPTGVEQYRLHGYSFSEVDYTVLAEDPSGQPLTRGTVLFSLRNQYLTAYSSVKMGIQNVTMSDGESKLTTVVDSNPVKGKLMKFRDLLPRLQQRMGAFGTLSNDNSFKLQIDPNGDGIIKPSAAIIGDWRQIPTASMFANCSGEASVALEPGAIKDYTLFFKYNGTLEKFIFGNRNVEMNAPNQVPASANPNAKGCFGQSCLFMLEKRMPTGGTDVVINFHYESRIGAVFGKRLGMLMQRGAAGQAEVFNP